mmetsp:Transcript_22327/g.60334  ORF Transcript_22327/g.60334 Transcript_22327/m.60334 type:complete len:262 (-) Transcript_22327:378-1163(-)
MLDGVRHGLLDALSTHAASFDYDTSGPRIRRLCLLDLQAHRLITVACAHELRLPVLHIQTVGHVGQDALALKGQTQLVPRLLMNPRFSEQFELGQAFEHREVDAGLALFGWQCLQHERVAFVLIVVAQLVPRERADEHSHRARRVKEVDENTLGPQICFPVGGGVGLCEGAHLVHRRPSQHPTRVVSWSREALTAIGPRDEHPRGGALAFELVLLEVGLYHAHCELKVELEAGGIHRCVHSGWSRSAPSLPHCVLKDRVEL